MSDCNILYKKKKKKSWSYDKQVTISSYGKLSDETMYTLFFHINVFLLYTGQKDLRNTQPEEVEKKNPIFALTSKAS